MKLNLGAVGDILPDYINCDLKLYADIDKAFDLRRKWPFKDSSVEEVRAFEVVEHLGDLVHFMDEAWRVLAPGGVLLVRSCLPNTENAWRDPTHVRPYSTDTYLYFDPESPWFRWGQVYTDKHWRYVDCQRVGKDAYLVKMTPRKEAVRKPSSECQDDAKNGKDGAGKQEASGGQG